LLGGTVVGRENNRRVELNILKVARQEKQDTQHGKLETARTGTPACSRRWRFNSGRARWRASNRKTWNRKIRPGILFLLEFLF